MTTIYGISNCDTVKKALKWLDAAGLDYRFHDFRKDGLDEARVRVWVDELGWEKILNRRSTTWRALVESVRNEMDNARAVSEIMNAPTLIKRPLLDTGDARYVGFSAKMYEDVFG